MACRALFGALGVIAVVLAPVNAEAAGTIANRQDSTAVQKPALPDEIPAPAAAPRAEQIKPVMVEPVKRVAPKALENRIKQVVSIENDPALSEQKKTTDNKKSCRAGQKRSGNGCTKVAANKPSGKKRR